MFGATFEAANTVELIVQSAYFGLTDERPKGQRKKLIGFKVIISNTFSAAGCSC